jgi:hypothetical protein
MRWLLNAPEGSVRFETDYPPGYSPLIFHSFVNCPEPPVRMLPPSASASGPAAAAAAPSATSSAASAKPHVHVAVGFVDLSTLAAAVDQPEWDAEVAAALADAQAAGGAGSSSGGGGGGGSGVLLKWYGLEASPYTVAKALVLRELLKEGPRAADAALQVRPCHLGCLHLLHIPVRQGIPQPYSASRFRCSHRSSPGVVQRRMDARRADGLPRRPHAPAAARRRHPRRCAALPARLAHARRQPGGQPAALAQGVRALRGVHWRVHGGGKRA